MESTDAEDAVESDSFTPFFGMLDRLENTVKAAVVGTASRCREYVAHGLRDMEEAAREVVDETASIYQTLRASYDGLARDVSTHTQTAVAFLRSQYELDQQVVQSMRDGYALRLAGVNNEERPLFGDSVPRHTQQRDQD
ncbi:MAG: hypothetical protein STHCBS139747_002204 [Sporothrix thermara]